VFDACRWDAFEAVCSDSEPVSTPGKDTPTWTEEVWCDSACDWSDVTYISGNQMVELMQDIDRYDGVLDEHVKETVMTNDLYDREEAIAPSTLVDLADEYDPPMVLHFLPPHIPFQGDVSLNIDLASYSYTDAIDTDFNEFREAWDAVREGHVSTDFTRLCYLKNLEHVWLMSHSIRNTDLKVVTTADHGEMLGPDQWGHVNVEDNQDRVVPFHANWDIELPDPESVGGAPSHDWTGALPASGRNLPIDGESVMEGVSGAAKEVKAQLARLGYSEFP